MVLFPAVFPMLSWRMPLLPREVVFERLSCGCICFFPFFICFAPDLGERTLGLCFGMEFYNDAPLASHTYGFDNCVACIIEKSI